MRVAISESRNTEMLRTSLEIVFIQPDSTRTLITLFAAIELIFFVVTCIGGLFWICDPNSVDNRPVF